MARLVRRLQPGAEIILGGHGAAIEGVEQLIPCDHVVKGEGIRWLRQHLGEDPDRPVVHPSIPSSDQKRIFGIPFTGKGALLVPGVGCVNGCRFCATSHFFGKAYTSFFETGAELFQNACRIAKDLGTEDFFMMDENFFKQEGRARELLALMEYHRRPFRFGLFTSAEAIESFGVENMVRLGVDFVWLGAESRTETYAKNQGRDLPGMIRSLRDHGILVLASSRTTPWNRGASWNSAKPSGRFWGPCPWARGSCPWAPWPWRASRPSGLPFSGTCTSPACGSPGTAGPYRHWAPGFG
jgi:hypothetical protein